MSTEHRALNIWKRLGALAAGALLAVPASANPFFQLMAAGGLPAIGFAQVGTPISTTTGANSYATASLTPSANALVLVAVINAKASAPDTPTLTGNGLTWVQIDTHTYSTIASATKRITLFRSMGASPSAGAITADFAGASQLGCHIYVCQFTATDQTGSNGSGAIVQTVKNRGDASADPSVTLAALTGTRNAVFAVFGNLRNGFAGAVEGAPWVEDFDAGFNTPATGAYAEHALATTDNTVVVTAASSDWAGIAVEIKAQ